MAGTPESAIAGLWKGLAVTKDNRFVVLVFFDQDADGLKGRFEMPEFSGQSSKGDLRVSLDGNRIGLATPGGIAFVGEMVGEDPKLIWGQLQARENKPVGTLTLFQQKATAEDDVWLSAYLNLF